MEGEKKNFPTHYNDSNNEGLNQQAFYLTNYSTSTLISTCCCWKRPT